MLLGFYCTHVLHNWKIIFKDQLRSFILVTILLILLLIVWYYQIACVFTISVCFAFVLLLALISYLIEYLWYFVKKWWK